MSWGLIRLKDVINKPISGEWGTGVGHIKVIRSTNFTNDGKLDLSDVVTRDIEPRKVEQKRLFYGDIIIEKSGGSPNQPVGRVVYFDINNDVYLCNNFTSVVRSNSEINSRYLFWFLFNNHLSGNTLKYQNKTTGIINLQLERYLQDLQIPLPPLPIQRRIAEILDAADALRRKDRELLHKYDELAQAIFIDMFGDPVKNEKGWEVKRLGDVFNVTSGGTPSTIKSEFWENGTIPWIGSNMCKNSVVYQSDGKFISELGLSSSSAKLIPADTVIIALVGATIGKVGLIRFSTTTNQNVAALVPKLNQQVNEWFTFYLTQFLYYKFDELGGDKFKMANLSFIRSLPFLLPPSESQLVFGKTIENLMEVKNKTETNHVNSLFDSCLQKAFKGELC